ncbi:MAG: DNA replication complex GINS family protein [Candidatus Bathyarchaeota archaeon]|nr:DNA replication complex GINS family protein [Candidatus Bathyarchaeota archaeon]
MKAGPFTEGKEYEIRFWIAQELEKAYVVRFPEGDMLDVTKLHKTHWKERVQPTNRLSPLQPEFYPKLRRYLKHLEESSQNNTDKLKEREKSKEISQDIVNGRVRKIVALATAPPLTVHALENLTTEERTLYYSLQETIRKWKNKILQTGDKND